MALLLQSLNHYIRKAATGGRCSRFEKLNLLKAHELFVTVSALNTGAKRRSTDRLEPLLSNGMIVRVKFYAQIAAS